MKCKICKKKLTAKNQEICLSCEINLNHKRKKINKKYNKYYEKYKQKIIKQQLKELCKIKIKRIYIRNYQTKRRKRDLNFKIKYYLRIRINQAIKNNIKRGHTLELLGCSIDFLKQYLEKQFKPGMSWANYGKWHIDHIRPCASFDLSKEKEQYKCFNYKNLQPLWAKDNLRKRKFDKKLLDK